MKTVCCLSPFIPPEWIAAHRMTPRLFVPPARSMGAAASGQCPYVDALLAAAAEFDDRLIVLTTTCDQMRRCAEVLEDWLSRTSNIERVFLFNVPATWHAQSRGVYRHELDRLSRFLVRNGGKKPDDKELQRLVDTVAGTRLLRTAPTAGHASAKSRIPVAVVGGHLLEDHRELYAVIEQLGGRIALDGSETGTRTAPSYAHIEGQHDILNLLTTAYFDTIPDAFRRPDSHLHAWVAAHVRAKEIRGIITYAYTWCDPWRAARNQIADAAGLPSLFIELGSEPSVLPRTRNRIQAFLETIA